MTDKTHADAPEANDTVGADKPMRTAQVGVKDHGDIVSGAAGEPMSGILADITDGDS